MWSNRARVTALAAALAVFGAWGLTSAATPLESIVITPQDGQTSERQRRDRYECHNWAIEQTGVVPGRPAEDASAHDDERAERIDRVITGASVGGAIGGLIRSSQRENPSQGVLAGGAIGAAVGALTGRREREEEEDLAFDAYFRALSACLEGRRYSVGKGS